MPPELSLLTTSDSELPSDDAAAFSLLRSPPRFLTRAGMAKVVVSWLPPAPADPPVRADAADDDTVKGVDEDGVELAMAGEGRATELITCRSEGIYKTIRPLLRASESRGKLDLCTPPPPNTNTSNHQCSARCALAPAKQVGRE